MPLHPQCQAVLDQLAAMPGKSFDQMSLQDIQDFRAALPNGMGLGGPPEPVARMEDRTVPTSAGEVPVRIYWPSFDRNLPVLLWAHGGGWVFGTIDWSDTTCRTLANKSGCIVISVDYRLAPEHPFPAGAEDFYDVTKYVAENAAEFGADGSRIAVGGDSAGGNLAAVACLMARDRGGPRIGFQLLIYPCVNYSDQSPSMRTNGDGYFLTEAGMKWFWHQYASADHAADPYLSPLKASTFRGLPQAMVITAEFDPLLDQGENYAQRLSEAGVVASLKRYSGMIHGFFNMGGVVDAGREVVEYSAAAVKRALQSAATAR
jgi:acetyl esterase